MSNLIPVRTTDTATRGVSMVIVTKTEGGDTVTIENISPMGAARIISGLAVGLSKCSSPAGAAMKWAECTDDERDALIKAARLRDDDGDMLSAIVTGWAYAHSISEGAATKALGSEIAAPNGGRTTWMNAALRTGSEIAREMKLYTI